MAGKKNIFDLFNEQNPTTETRTDEKIVVRDTVEEKEKVVQNEEPNEEQKEVLKEEPKPEPKPAPEPSTPEPSTNESEVKE